MLTLQTQGASAPTFCASAWLADWSDNGGVAFLAAGRLYLSRIQPIDRIGRERLDGLRNEIVADRRHGEALAAFLIARSHGEGV
jgi:hypothetical protein